MPLFLVRPILVTPVSRFWDVMPWGWDGTRVIRTEMPANVLVGFNRMVFLRQKGYRTMIPAVHSTL